MQWCLAELFQRHLVSRETIILGSNLKCSKQTHKIAISFGVWSDSASEGGTQLGLFHVRQTGKIY